MAKRGKPNSIKGGRRWCRLGRGAIIAAIIGPLWKGMGKSNYRKLNGRRKDKASLQIMEA